LYCDDDRIAPTGVSRSTDDLQRWALMTATMSQQPTNREKTQHNEEEIHNRIQQRYQGPIAHPEPVSEPEQERAVIDLTDDNAFPPLGQRQDNPLKRPLSDFLSSMGDASHDDNLSAVSYVQFIKRVRTPSPSPRHGTYSASNTEILTARSDQDDDTDSYYQSSEWNFPSSPEEKCKR
jgi:hypothetical protein